MKNYLEMSKWSIIDYVKENNIFPKDSELFSKDVGDGNLNYVFRVFNKNNSKSVIVKQALPYLKIAGEGWKLTLNRNKIEAEAMQLQGKITPNFVPKIFHHDDDYALTVMEDLGEMSILRKGLMSMKKYPNFPKQIGEFLAKNLFFTSDLGLGAIQKKKYISKFINPELCDITEKLVLTNPYFNSTDNDINKYILDFVQAEIWNSEKIKIETAKLKNIFMTKAEALLHGDLHTGSIFISENEIKIFDAEFAFYGPYSYDIGLLMANILLNYVSWDGKPEINPNKKIDYQLYLLNLLSDIWDNFKNNFIYYWNNFSKEKTTTTPGYLEYYLNNILQESIGFCSCEIMRRIIGMAHVPDLDEIQNLENRSKAQILGLRIAKNIIINRAKITNFNDFIKLITKGE